MAKNFLIKHRKIGINEPPLVVAEIGINHEGNLDLSESNPTHKNDDFFLICSVNDWIVISTRQKL